MSEKSVTVRLEQQRDYQIANLFGVGVATLLADEPPPLGQGAGPEPVQLLAASVGNCLVSSLLFALRKYKQAPEPLRAEVNAQVGRNPQGRLRVHGMAVRIDLGVPGSSLQHLDRALSQFEDFCTVTASVRASIPVSVEVFDSLGARLR